MFRVEWLRPAQEALARQWINADSELRKSITVACHKVDQQLQADPWDQSESRFGNTRVLLQFPLCVYFDVHDDAKTVVVLKVRVYRKRKK